MTRQERLATAARAADTKGLDTSLARECGVVWMPGYSADDLMYVREARGWHRRVGDKAPKGVCAFAVHPIGCRCGMLTRIWYVEQWDSYEAGPIEAVDPQSIQPGRASVKWSKVAALRLGRSPYTAA